MRHMLHNNTGVWPYSITQGIKDVLVYQDAGACRVHKTMSLVGLRAGAVSLYQDGDAGDFTTLNTSHKSHYTLLKTSLSLGSF